MDQSKEDEVIWPYTKHGNVTVKSCYNLLEKQNAAYDGWKYFSTVRKARIQHKLKPFLLSITQSMLPIKVHVRKKITDIHKR